MLSSIARESQCYVIGGSIPESDSGKLYNTSTSFGPDGTMLAKHRKVGCNKCVSIIVLFKEVFILPSRKVF